MPKSPQQLTYGYEDLIYGLVKNYPPSKLPKNKKDINQRQFLNSPELIKKHGFWANSDGDRYPNFADSFPFDSNRHGLISWIKKKLSKESEPVMSTTPELQAQQSLPSDGGYTGGIEAHRTPSGYVPPPVSTTYTPTPTTAPAPTSTEQALQMSLPPELRDQPVEVVSPRQSLLPKRELTRQQRAFAAAQKREQKIRERREKIIRRETIPAEEVMSVDPKMSQVLYIKQKTVDTFRPKGKLKEVPITEYVIVDASGKEIRKATQEEIKFARSKKVLQASERLPPPKVTKFAEKVEEKKEKIITKIPIVEETYDFIMGTGKFKPPEGVTSFVFPLPIGGVKPGIRPTTRYGGIIEKVDEGELITVISKTDVGTKELMGYAKVLQRIEEGKTIQEGFGYVKGAKKPFRIYGAAEDIEEVAKVKTFMKKGETKDVDYLLTGYTKEVGKGSKGRVLTQREGRIDIDDVIGMSKETKGIIYGEAGRPKLIKKPSGKRALRAEPTQKGYLLRVEEPETLLFKRPMRVTKKKTPFEITFAEELPFQIPTPKPTPTPRPRPIPKVKAKVRPEIRTEKTIAALERQAVIEAELVRPVPAALFDVRVKTKQDTALKLFGLEVEKAKPREVTKITPEIAVREAPSQILIPIQIQPLREEEKQIQLQIMGRGETGRPPPTPMPDFTFPGEIEPFGLKPKVKYVKEKPYDAYAYVDATKKGEARYEKLNEEPLTLKSALSKMGRYVDKNISARGKVSPTPVKIKKGKKGEKGVKIMPKVKETGDNYFEDNLMKFRPYRYKKGQPVPLKEGTYIEKQRYRLDSPGEVGKIQRAKRRAKSVRGFFGL